MKKKLLSLVLILVLVCATLTGCMVFEVETTVQSDGSGTVAMGTFIEKELYEELLAAASETTGDTDDQPTITKKFDGVEYLGEYETATFAGIYELRELLIGSPEAVAGAVEDYDTSKPLVSGLEVFTEYDEQGYQHIVVSFGVIDKMSYAESLGFIDEGTGATYDESELDEMISTFKTTLTFNFPDKIVDYKAPAGCFEKSTKGITFTLNPGKEATTYYVEALMDNKIDLKMPDAHFNSVQMYDNIFTDVAATAWYKNYVKSAYEKGIVAGATETTFNPSGKLSIAEAVTLAARIHSIYNDNNEGFAAAAGEAWYKPYETYAIENNIIAANRFEGRMGASATRGEMAYIFANTLPEETYVEINKTAKVPDMTSKDMYYNDVLKLYTSGIVQGNAKGEYNPLDNVTRAETVTIISNLVTSQSRTAGK